MHNASPTGKGSASASPIERSRRRSQELVQQASDAEVLHLHKSFEMRLRSIDAVEVPQTIAHDLSVEWSTPLRSLPSSQLRALPASAALTYCIRCAEPEWVLVMGCDPFRATSVDMFSLVRSHGRLDVGRSDAPRGSHAPLPSARTPFASAAH